MEEYLKVNNQGRCYYIHKYIEDPVYPIETIYEYNGHKIAEVEFIPGAKEAGEKSHQLTCFDFRKESVEYCSGAYSDEAEAEKIIKDFFGDYIKVFEQAHNLIGELNIIKNKLKAFECKYSLVKPTSFDILFEALDSCTKETVETIGSISYLK